MLEVRRAYGIVLPCSTCGTARAGRCVSWSRAPPAVLITEEEDQVDAAALDAALVEAVGGAAGFRRRGGLQAQELAS